PFTARIEICPVSEREPMQLVHHRPTEQERERAGGRPFFFLAPRQPPRSALFPYTTLFRSLGRGHKQAMVATRVQTDDRRGGEASKAVGFQPLATESRVHVTADFWFELNHGCSCV